MAKYTAQDRRDLAEKGHALPDGSFPIADDEDLRSAIRNWALGKEPEVAKRHIVKRARAMNSYGLLPEKWRAQLVHSYESTNDFLAHFGVKGMKWGVVHDEQKSERAQARKELQKEKDVRQAQKYIKRSSDADRTIKELDKLGIHSPEMRKLYGRAVDQSDRMFYLATGTTKDRAVEKARNSATRNKAIAEKDAESVANGGLSRGQKLAIGGGIAAAGLLLAYGAYKYPDIVTRNAQSGSPISVNNFMQRYGKRSTSFITETVSKEAFHAMSDVDVKVPKGTVFKRLTAFPDEDLGKRLYTTFTDADNDKYQGIYGAVLRQRTGLKNLHISSMTMGEEIRSPSQKKRVQFLMDMLDEDKGTYLDPYGAKTNVRSYLSDLIREQEKYMFASGKTPSNPFTGKESNEEVALRAYNVFARQVVGDHSIHNAYFDKIKKLGYNALVDDNDATQLSDVPMILLDAAKTTTSRSSTPLTASMEKQARKRLVEVLGN